MAPIRSEAAVAAAPAVTRSGRHKNPSQAALRAGKRFSSLLHASIFSLFFSVSSENHEAQQARRSRTGGRHADMNARGSLSSHSLRLSQLRRYDHTDTPLL